MSQDLLKANAKLIVDSCSPKHIQSIIEDLQQQLLIAKRLKVEVLSLNPNCNTIGAGKLASMQWYANKLDKI